MIRHWCDAVGDANPIYTDPAAAAASAHGGIVAPPTMLQAWIMPGLRSGASTHAPDALNELMSLLDDEGYTGVVATNCEQEYLRYLRPPDLLTVSSQIEEISEEKRTGLGTGFFVTLRDTFTDQDGMVVGRMLFRILKFRPAAALVAKTQTAPPPRRPRPAINDDNRFFWEGVARGELLIQRCVACGRLRHPPRPMCPGCRSLEWDALTACGRGTVYSYVVPYHPPIPPFSYPHAVALIELEEGTRLVSNIVGVDPASVRIGMPVELTMVAVDDELTLPQFRPAEAAT